MQGQSYEGTKARDNRHKIGGQAVTEAGRCRYGENIPVI